MDVFSEKLDDLKIITLTDGEVWSARDLMPFAGYKAWQDWSRAINRAIISVNASGLDAAEHFRGAPKTSPMPNGGTKQIEDVELTRYGCYILFQNADGSKQEVAAAQQYFAVKTRQAEVSQRETPSGAELIALAVLEAQAMLTAKDQQIAELEPKAAQADTFRQADGLRTIGDLANDLKVHAASNHAGVKILRDDVFDLAGIVGLIIRGNTVRKNQPTSRAIEAGWVKPKDTTVDTHNHGSFVKVSARLTPRGYGRLWDAAGTNLKKYGSVLMPKEDADLVAQAVTA
ncbi:MULTISPECIES: phage antirepressor KilAC domain-containing protein [unclassified Leucobacter]|uniref:phage antirepressor KilAC domain-containing protein n=1 Tax=unclassified Leucobacter TaxID=2621730 RepID=UPI00165D32FB